ncbi:hypothetical protein GOARA_091_00160 [Gordonia araii NBRC 100433]|uniref:Uncharacterized protein n=1 Tax=Gordonia araii NBRC 100433 TaxID=1073574 RepID=G7H7S3_9ACTN|nr:hypothetical protein [Gordonia araii]NNG95661.1 hypothetical protein [Gordonia araii NBRC 100433]GAB11898.1 hypothetical protein GOARA_091_00160 [Gordonia araii NBRC 100433]
MTYNSGQFPQQGGGRHRSPGDRPDPEPRTRAYSDYNPGQFTGGQAYGAPPYGGGYDTGAYEAAAYGEPEEYGEPEAGEGGDGRPPRHPWVLASLVGVTVFLATVIIGGTLWAVNDSKERKSENYADGPPTSTVTVTESVTTTTTTTVTSTPSRSTDPSSPYGSDDDGGNAATASTGWYAQFGSFTSYDSAVALAEQTSAEVYRGEEFGQPGQYIVAQREYSQEGAREACDIAEQSCVVKQVS